MTTPTTPLRLSLLLCLVGTLGTAPAWARQPAPLPEAQRAASVAAAPSALEFAARVRATQDNGQKPFAIIDKPNAAVTVFDAQGRELGTSPVLLGLAKGDESVPGIGERPMRLIKQHERTTPAGRFMSQAGRNTGKEDVVWVDYAAAVSMHRVRANVKADRRLERLASATTDDNRISYGCVNVPADFYDAWVKPNLSDQVGVIYVLPDQKPVAQVFDFVAPSTAAAQAQ